MTIKKAITVLTRKARAQSLALRALKCEQLTIRVGDRDVEFGFERGTIKISGTTLNEKTPLKLWATYCSAYKQFDDKINELNSSTTVIITLIKSTAEFITPTKENEL